MLKRCYVLQIMLNLGVAMLTCQHWMNLSVDGCPNGCGAHGTCRLFHVGWACTCLDGWKGTACEIAMETSCNGGSDEDGGKHWLLMIIFPSTNIQYIYGTCITFLFE